MSIGRRAMAVLSCDLRRGLTHSFPHVHGRAQSQEWLLLLPPMPLLSASHSVMLILLGTKQAVFGNCCCVILGFFVEFSGSCFCGKSMLKCNAKHLKCYLCHPDLTIQCIIPHYSTAQSHAVLFHKAPASFAVQHEWCSENTLVLSSEKTYPMFCCLMQKLEGMQ